LLKLWGVRFRRRRARATVRELRRHPCGHTEPQDVRKAPPDARNQSSAPRQCSASWTRSLTRPPPESRDFVDRFSERIQALSSIGPLVRNEWNGVEIRGPGLRLQLKLFADLIGFDRRCKSPRLRFEKLPRASENIGLALHELATNAGKYWALDGSGRVDVRWGTKWRHLHQKFGPARRTAGVCAKKKAARVRHHSFGSEWSERSVYGTVDWIMYPQA